MALIRVYHSYRSPYSRLALHIIKRAGLDVDLVPFTGPPEGNPFYDPMQNEAKLSYYMLDIPRMTSRMGLPLSLPEPFEVDFTKAYKASVAASMEGCGLAFALCLSDARWGAGRDVSDMDVIKQCAEDCGWSAQAAEDAQASGAVKEEMKRHRELIEKDKVFGVPFAIFGDKKYWGHDRFDLLVQDASK